MRGSRDVLVFSSLTVTTKSYLLCLQLNILSNSSCTWYSSPLFTPRCRAACWYVHMHSVFACVHCFLLARAGLPVAVIAAQAEQWSFGLLSSLALPPGPSPTNLAPSPLLSAFSCLLFSLPAWPLIIPPSVFLSVLVTCVPPPPLPFLEFLTALLPSPSSLSALSQSLALPLLLSAYLIHSVIQGVKIQR